MEMKAASLTASPGLPSIVFNSAENVSFSVCAQQPMSNGASNPVMWYGLHHDAYAHTAMLEC